MENRLAFDQMTKGLEERPQACRVHQASTDLALACPTSYRHSTCSEMTATVECWQTTSSAVEVGSPFWARASSPSSKVPTTSCPSCRRTMEATSCQTTDSATCQLHQWQTRLVAAASYYCRLLETTSATGCSRLSSTNSPTYLKPNVECHLQQNSLHLQQH